MGDALITFSTSEVARLALESLLRLVEQPHVLDRDHRLVGEGLQQLDVVRREASGLDPGHADHADGNAFAHEQGREAGCESPRLRASRD